MTTLTRYTILVPVFMPDGESLVPPRVLDSVRDRMIERFGGATVEPPATGSWIGADGRVDEPMIAVWALATNGTPSHADEDYVRVLAADLARWTGQEAVLVYADEVRAAFVAAQPPVTV